MNSVFKVVKEKISEIFIMNGLEKLEITMESRIIQDLGLKSLDIAQLIAMLDVEYGKDPFSDGTAKLENIITVSGLCKLYI